jgi:hypothetical protein
MSPGGDDEPDQKISAVYENYFPYVVTWRAALRRCNAAPFRPLESAPVITKGRWANQLSAAMIRPQSAAHEDQKQRKSSRATCAGTASDRFERPFGQWFRPMKTPKDFLAFSTFGN